MRSLLMGCSWDTAFSFSAPVFSSVIWELIMAPISEDKTKYFMSKYAYIPLNV